MKRGRSAKTNQGAVAPGDDTFDYFETQLREEELTALVRPALDPQTFALKDHFTFQVLSCKSAYVRGDSNPMVAWEGTRQVPVIRVYGVLASGQSVCVNVWNFSPYLFINAPEGTKITNPESTALQIQNALEVHLERHEATRKNGGWSSTFNKTPPSTVTATPGPKYSSPFEASARKSSTKAAPVDESRMFDGAYDDEDPLELMRPGRGMIGGLDQFGTAEYDSSDDDDGDEDGSSFISKTGASNTFKNTHQQGPTDDELWNSVLTAKDDPFAETASATPLIGAFDSTYGPDMESAAFMDAGGGSARTDSWQGGGYEANNKHQPKIKGTCIVAVVPEQFTIADHWKSKSELVFAVHVRTPNMVTVVRDLIGDGHRAAKLAKGLYVRGPTYESGIRFENRFMLDRNIVGTGWAQLKGASYKVRPRSECETHCTLEVDVDAQDILGFAPHERADLYATPSRMRVMSYDIECMALEGFPKAERDPVININVVGYEVGDPEKITMDISLVLGSCDDIGVGTSKRTVCFEHERDLLNAFGQLKLLFDPDIVTGYNIVNFDNPYLLDRSTLLGADDFIRSTRHRLSKLTGKIETRQSKNNGNSERFTLQCEGRVFIDMFFYAQNNMYKKLRSYSLNAVAAEVLNDQKEDVDYTQIPILHNGSRTDRQRLRDYCRKDAILPQRLMNKLSALISLFELTRVQRVQLDQQQNGGASFKVFSQLLYKMRQSGFIVPYRREYERKDYQGATVFEPERGYYNKDPTAVLDFGSLYPSIVIADNTCITTHIERPEHVENVMETYGFGTQWRAARDAKDKTAMATLETEVIYTCPVGHRYVRAKYKKGVFPAMEEELLALRAVAKAFIATAKTIMEKNVANRRQEAIKIAANSGYGFHGLISNGTYWFWIAESVTAGGRDQIDLTKRSIETKFRRANGYKGDARVIYGDTDSVMILFGIPIANVNDPASVSETITEAIVLAKEAAAFCTSLFAAPNSLNFENVFFPYLLINKKRYGAQVWTNGNAPASELKIRGLESVRRDNCRLMAQTQGRCLDLILRKNEPERALNYVYSQIRSLLEGKVDFYDLILSGQLSKYQKDYKVKQAHAEVREKMERRNPGSGPKIGDRVPYILIDLGKKAKRFECAEDPMFALKHKLPVNARYYLDKQMLKPLIRVFKPIYKDADSLIRNGEHTRHVNHLTELNPTEGLGMFFKKLPMCAGCGVTLSKKSLVTKERTVEHLVCTSCEPQRINIYTSVLKEKRQAENAYARIWANCQDCQGSRFKEVICSAQSCSVYYKRFALADSVKSLTTKLRALGLDD